MKYQCLQQDVFQKIPYELVPIRHQDMADIKIWRNDQLDILRQNDPLTEEQQELYWKEALTPTFTMEYPGQVLFSYLLEGRCIGYGGLTHIDWNARRAEVSFLLETERNRDIELYCREFSIFLSLLLEVAFEGLQLHRLFTETYAIRSYVVETLEAFGFELEGRLREHAYIQGRYVDALIHGYLGQ